MSTQKSKKVLFVCLGNICRSPTAEGVFKAVTEKKKNPNYNFTIDSCGTGGGSSNWYEQGGFSFHEGDSADSRMKKAASKRGYNLTSRSRPLTKNDFDQFDLILGMEQKNVDAIEEAAHYWKVPQEKMSKVGLITSYIQKGPYVGVKSIPDPYYGGESGFEKVLDLLEDICEQLYEQVTKD